MSAGSPSLSIVIPAYNERERIQNTLRETLDFLRSQPPRRFEVIVVDDGSQDGTPTQVESLEDPAVRCLPLGRNRGKGAAVRTGILDAKGDRILFMDADLSTPIEELQLLEDAMDRGFHIAIGSRALPESRLERRQPLPRELMGRTFNVLVKQILFSGIADTQCGFKLFTRPVARELFGNQQLDGFAFDVEVLWLAQQANIPILEVPVRWRHEDRSKVSPVTDSSKMLFDLLKLRARSWLGGA